MIWLALGILFLALFSFGRKPAMGLAARLSPAMAYRINDSVSLRERASRARAVMHARAQRRPNAQYAELVELVDLLAVVERVLASGDSTLGAIAWIGKRGRGRDAKQFEGIARRVAAGAELGAELAAWQGRARSAELQDLLTKLISTTNSGADVVAIVANLRSSVEGAIRAAQLAALGKSEMRMMIPIVFLVLPITVLFAVFPSLTLLNLTIQ